MNSPGRCRGVLLPSKKSGYGTNCALIVGLPGTGAKEEVKAKAHEVKEKVEEKRKGLIAEKEAGNQGVGVTAALLE